jgi:hypothetical protein
MGGEEDGRPLAPDDLHQECVTQAWLASPIPGVLCDPTAGDAAPSFVNNK